MTTLLLAPIEWAAHHQFSLISSSSTTTATNSISNFLHKHFSKIFPPPPPLNHGDTNATASTTIIISNLKYYLTNNNGPNNSTQCYDLFPLSKDVAKFLPILTSSIMILLFGLIAVWALVSLLRLTLLRPRNRYFVFRSTRILFYLFIFIFCCGKIMFFAVGIAEKGYISLYTTTASPSSSSTEVETTSFLSELYHLDYEFLRQTEELYNTNTTTMNKRDDEKEIDKTWLLNGISNLFHQWTSTFFYSAFCLLTMYWSQNLMFAWGMAEKIVKSALANAQRFLLILNILMHVVQASFTIVVSTMLIMGAVTGKSSAFYILMTCDRLYQCALVVAIIVFFIVWGLYVKSKMSSNDRFSVVYSSQIHETNKIRNATALISVIIALKLVWNLGMMVLEVSDWALCLDDYFLVVSFVDFVADCIPISIVVFLMAPSVHVRDSVEEEDVITGGTNSMGSYESDGGGSVSYGSNGGGGNNNYDSSTKSYYTTNGGHAERETRGGDHAFKRLVSMWSPKQRSSLSSSPSANRNGRVNESRSTGPENDSIDNGGDDHDEYDDDDDEGGSDMKKLIVRKGYDSPVAFERSLFSDRENTFRIDPVHQSFLVHKQSPSSFSASSYHNQNHQNQHQNSNNQNNKDGYGTMNDQSH